MMVCRDCGRRRLRGELSCPDCGCGVALAEEVRARVVRAQDRSPGESGARRPRPQALAVAGGPSVLAVPNWWDRCAGEAEGFPAYLFAVVLPLPVLVFGLLCHALASTRSGRASGGRIALAGAVVSALWIGLAYTLPPALQ